MIQTMKNPYHSTARTAEIMSKYRPIAPKPPADHHAINTATKSSENYGVINKSPYLRNVWAHLQARPTRTRKRGRTAGFAPASVKRARANCVAMHGIMSTPFVAGPRFVQLKCGLGARVPTLSESTAVVPILCSTEGVDFNNIQQGPRELDFLGQVSVKPRVISPRPVRPVGSSVIVKDVTDVVAGRCIVVKGPEEMEKVVEGELGPAIVSDSKNKVRMTNSAYKEMVGQPECGWLDCAGGGGRRIGGEVLLLFVDLKAVSRDGGFSCGVEIEWESNGEKRSVGASCDVVKLICEAKQYQFLWRFRMSD